MASLIIQRTSVSLSNGFPSSASPLQILSRFTKWVRCIQVTRKYLSLRKQPSWLYAYSLTAIIEEIIPSLNLGGGGGLNLPFLYKYYNNSKSCIVHERANLVFFAVYGREITRLTTGDSKKVLVPLVPGQINRVLRCAAKSV